MIGTSRTPKTEIQKFLQNTLLNLQKRIQILKPKGNSGPLTQIGISKLATWTVLQGLVLVGGFHRWLYNDPINMRESVDHLRRALQLPTDEGSPDYFPSRERNSVVDPDIHYNHLHAEWIPSLPSLLTPENITILNDLAKERDEDDSFLNTMFEKSNIDYVDKLKEDYQDYSACKKDRK